MNASHSLGFNNDLSFIAHITVSSQMLIMPKFGTFDFCNIENYTYTLTFRYVIVE